MAIDTNNFNAFGAQPIKANPMGSSSAAFRGTASQAGESAKFAASYGQARLDAIPGDDQRWSWVEVDLGAIRNNVQVVKRIIPAGCRFMAVVKADGYGHGAVEVARASIAAGANQLAVAGVYEAVELRKAGITAPILVLSEPPAESIPLLLAYDIMPSVYSAEFAIAYAEMADLHGMRAPYHLAVNTGMNRIGVRFDEVIDFCRQVEFHRALDRVGTFTHFATADCAETFDFSLQFRRFCEVIDGMRQVGLDPGIVHCANSAATLRYPQTHLDMVRFGISLYGYHPCIETRGHFDLRPAMSLHARITAVNTPPMSEGVSYGLHYRSPGSVKICAVPVGYADGFSRGLSGRTAFIYGGRLCKQVGNICMDQCMFEVDLRTSAMRSRLDPHVGDEVVLFGSKDGCTIYVEDLCDVLNTIPHEIICAMSLRMPKVYLK
ncbi:alanine racemase [Slackia heliotrinireducens]|jgi:alanine racemase|uniref:Alanine racemase n=1 Tax=Slackia heliotrinireducens (strain ATCC 29202 / DSM 20476 / NCTC 11029 / RHS 1) TaxID=471855 RepID=C7N4J1_SLAHD|nr:alanine racemase [Slackia heliotrinireducens]ACV21826.1 alanine racemase [Slackia heliotrinireducens DSM 20476]VEG99548.1 Alanine racemase [Slackia heliotrinireducens]